MTMTRDHDSISKRITLLQPHPTMPKPITDTASLSGLRLCFNVFVVVLHTVVFLAVALDYPTDAISIISGSIPAFLLSIIITLGSASVDIFFVISGFLLKAAFAKSPPTLSSSVRYILFRYLRLAPAYVTIALAMRAMRAPNCLNISEVFLLNTGDYKKLCVGVGWSTQVDFASHILLLPVLSYPRILASIVLLTPPYRLFTWLRQGKPYLPVPPIVTDFIETPQDLENVQKLLGLQSGNYDLTDTDIYHRRSMVKAYDPLYFGLPSRIAAIVVGVLVYSCMQNKNAVYRTLRRFPGISLACMTLVWGLYYSVEQSLIVSHFAQMAFHSLGRISIAVATSVVILLTCSVEDTQSEHRISRVLHGVLTSRPMVFLERFSYVVYLLHTIVAPMLVVLPPKFNTQRFTPGWVFLLALKLYTVAVVLGLPIFGIERLALRGRAWLRSKVFGRGQDFGGVKKDV